MDTKMYKMAVTVGGNYVHGTQYDILTQVYYEEDGCSYVSRKGNVNVRPGTDDTVWQKVSEKGQKGDTGPAGPIGPQGEPAPVVASLESESDTDALAASMGLALKELIDAIKSGDADIIDKSSGMTQAQINQMVVSGNISVSLSATPSPIFVGAERTISLSATSNTSATSITIKKGSTTIASGTGISLSGSDTITPSSAGNTSYSAEFVIGSITKTATKSVTAVYPIRVGTGASYVEGTALSSAKTSPSGTYNVMVANDGEYIFFNVPSTMSIGGATMGGFAFPLEASQSKTIGGVSYKSYRSSNTYDAGTLTIVIS